MKNKRLATESLMILCYIFDLYHLSALCRYGGAKRHLLWMFLGLLVFCAALIYRLITDAPKIKSKTAFLVKLMTVIGATVLFASSIIYSAIPYNGKLAWKIDELLNERQETSKLDKQNNNNPQENIEPDKNDTDTSTESSATIGETYTDEDGNLCFFLSDTTGWRFQIIDAAAGSRFYGLQKTTDGGENWEMINEDPFVGMIGITEGLVFFDENNGIIGLTCAGQDWSYLYRTDDGGKTFTQIAFPGASVDQYYYDMPRQDKDQLVVLARSEAGAASGVKFVSKDGGMTWENAGDF